MEKNPIKIIKLDEHCEIESSDKEYVEGFNLDFHTPEINQAPQYLGINNYKASYYIGADWLSINQCAVVITPKITTIDFVEMFCVALKFADRDEYSANFFDINFNAPEIESETLDSILTPLLIIRYVNILEKLTKRGLKKDYITKEENLKSKIKGRILINNNLKINTLKERYDRFFCRYQEYTTDIPENRLLKKALLFTKNLVENQKNNKHKRYNELKTRINKLLNHFTNISENVEISEIKRITSNVLLKEHRIAIIIAKMILRRYDYNIQKTGNIQKTVPPFWIDMSKLYELYVLSILEEAYPGQINFQVSGYEKTRADFTKLDERIVMDTKYKPQYDESQANILDDIRQLSAYSRDVKILNNLKYGEKENPFVPCVIIYPNRNSNLDYTKKIIEQSDTIHGFRGFYKIGIRLPELKSQSIPTN